MTKTHRYGRRFELTHLRPRGVSMKKLRLLLPALLLSVQCFRTQPTRAQASYLYGEQPGKAVVEVSKTTVVLRNSTLSATWSTDAGGISRGSFRSPGGEEAEMLLGDPFTIVFADSKSLKASAMQMVEAPRVENLDPSPAASRLEEHFSGKRAIVQLKDPVSNLVAVWSGELRDGDNYVRQEVSLSCLAGCAIREVRLFDCNAPGASVVGSVKGSPIVRRNIFLGFEHPLSHCAVEQQHARCFIERELPLKPGQLVSYSSVIGISPAGQMRRAFLNYVERERAHPYRPFLHYNSWYDIGYGNRYDQAAALDVISAFGKELHEKRGVQLDSFLFDDGWDDPHSLWSFDSGFPRGFTPLNTAAAAYGAAPGIWLSPWGGYDQAKQQRLKYGAQEGFETNKGGFALSGPKYFARFREVTLEFIEKYKINQFKIDGTGNVNSVFPKSEFDSDFHAAISLIEEWRQQKPDIFVNLTTGTYPSPFWLRYADSIWRGGEDHSFAGVGPWREKWITYRDANTFSGIVRQGPLFPLNSLMLHGIIYARQAEHLGDDPDQVFSHEVQDYFATGTQLQEMYITHALLTPADWDTLAEAANWSRHNASVLVDTHWIGGDPAKLEVYGWAAWTPEKGIVTLRNPGNQPQIFSLDVAQAFELPDLAARKFTAHSPWARDQQQSGILLTAGEPHTFKLLPFEVVTIEAVPQR
jgi:hypothetical protein